MNDNPIFRSGLFSQQSGPRWRRARSSRRAPTLRAAVGRPGPGTRTFSWTLSNASRGMQALPISGMRKISSLARRARSRFTNSLSMATRGMRSPDISGRGRWLSRPFPTRTVRFWRPVAQPAACRRKREFELAPRGIRLPTHRLTADNLLIFQHLRKGHRM